MSVNSKSQCRLVYLDRKRLINSQCNDSKLTELGFMRVSVNKTALRHSIVLLLATAWTCSAAPRIDGSSVESIPIVRSSIDGPNPDGSYRWEYETGNGIRAEEQGDFQPGKSAEEQGASSVRGSYSYRGDDGVDIALTYTADENGFQPQGQHLPVAPEIPPAILRALEWIANHPEEDSLRK
ncbi:hypothetical protein QAD02_009366 [Eretmocerus hayati]|uniref:Uncharacterized protein n=1 Tax=Eretmocerus hayati TaxID=131215 RepID=A0ACC2N9A4_9HYME|nr:hypothetical protein QAD02_009366 [Eretmocerus hayati]